MDRGCSSLEMPGDHQGRDLAQTPRIVDALVVPRLRETLVVPAPLTARDDLTIPATMERAVRIRVVAAQPNITGISRADPGCTKGADGWVGPWGPALHAVLPTRHGHGSDGSRLQSR